MNIKHFVFSFVAFPTYVGMIPMSQSVMADERGVPHICGDDSNLDANWLITGKCSLHSWGWPVVQGGFG